MTSSGCTFVSCISALLSSVCEADERQALESIMDFLAKDGDAWSLLQVTSDETSSLCERLLVYALARTFAASSTLVSVVKKDALATAQAIPALARPEANLTALVQQLLDQLQRVQWAPELLGRLSKTIQQVEDPRVRQQAIQFGYSVLKNHGAQDTSEDWYREASQVLLLGVTDVWSAVRKQSAHAAVAILHQFRAFHEIDSFVGLLLKLAGDADWKPQEGALLALTAFVSSIETETTPATIPKSVHPSVRTADMIKGAVHASAPVATIVVYHFGDRHRALPHRPRSLTLKLKPTLYTSLKHAQGSVREAAAQCFVHYMGICDEATRVLTFQEVVSKLNRLNPESTDNGNSCTHVELLDAAEAEGLLDVLARLVPQLPVAFLVKHWKLVFPTLERYVMHIASTVRLRSSSVVLALGERALGDNAHAIELLYQMLLALAEKRLDVGVCWQRLEGRLLSVDLLVGLLGKDGLWRMGSDQNLLHFVSQSRSTRLLCAEDWLPAAMSAQATWTLDEAEEQHVKRVRASSLSILQRLNAYATTKNRPPSEMWQRLLHGWLSQTRAAFDSTQFELRRIARQVLPSLVRLCLWCEQLPQLVHASSTSTKAVVKATGTNTPLDAWTCVCLRHVMLHTQFVRESRGLLWKEQQDWTLQASVFVLDTLETVHLEPATSQHEPEAVVARVEAILLVTLAHYDPEQLAFVNCAIRDVHKSLPTSFQHPLASVAGGSPLSSVGCLDRQFSIALVMLLPAIVRRLVVVSGDLLLWRMATRITLSWLVTDDMFRWITIDKATAQASLLLALSELLASTMAEADVDNDDLSLVLQTLESAVPMTHQRVKDSVSDLLVSIYVSLWRFPSASKIHQRIVVNLACLHYQRCQAATVVKLAALKSDWDDWDGDNASAKDQELRPTSVLTDGDEETSVVIVVRSLVSSERFDSLVVELQRLLDTDGFGHHRHAVQSLVASLVHTSSNK